MTFDVRRPTVHVSKEHSPSPVVQLQLRHTRECSHVVRHKGAAGRTSVCRNQHVRRPEWHAAPFQVGSKLAADLSSAVAPARKPGVVDRCPRKRWPQNRPPREGGRAPSASTSPSARRLGLPSGSPEAATVPPLPPSPSRGHRALRTCTGGTRLPASGLFRRRVPEDRSDGQAGVRACPSPNSPSSCCSRPPPCDLPGRRP